MVYSAGAGAELARVRCGGWRRQCAHLIASPADFTFAFYRDRRIHLARRRERASIQTAQRPALWACKISCILCVSRDHSCLPA